MKKQLFICLILILAVMLAACSQQAPTPDNSAAPSHGMESIVDDTANVEQTHSKENQSPATGEDIPLQEPETSITGTTDTNQSSSPETEKPVSDESTPSQETEGVTEGTSNMEQSQLPDENEYIPEDNDVQEKKLVLSVNGRTLDVNWENNDTVTELISYAQYETIVVHTTLYGGFEQVGSLPQGFSRNDEQTTTDPGDLVLYSGNQLVLFFGSNSWSYTMLGHIEGLSASELSELLSGSTAVIEIKLI